MSDGRDLWREWISPRLAAPEPVQAGADGVIRNSLESFLPDWIARRLNGGARDVDVAIRAETVEGHLCPVVAIRDVARGWDLTGLRSFLSGRETFRHDWTTLMAGPFFLPAGCVLGLLTTCVAGQSLEAWITADGNWEIHTRSLPGTGTHLQLFFPGADAARLEARIQGVLKKAFAMRPGGFRMTLSTPEKPGKPFPVVLENALITTRLELPQGVFDMSLHSLPGGVFLLCHKGKLIERVPCPIPHNSVCADLHYRPETGDLQRLVQDVLPRLRRQLEEAGLEGIRQGNTHCWLPLCAGIREDFPLELPLGEDLCGRSFTGLDFLERIPVVLDARTGVLPDMPRFLFLDSDLWSAPDVERSRLVLERLTGRTPASFSGLIGASRLVPGERLKNVLELLNGCFSLQDPRLRFAEGWVPARLENPTHTSWPFFPGSGNMFQALDTLTRPPWPKATSLWVAVNHPLVQRILQRPAPEAACLLARLYLVSARHVPDETKLTRALEKSRQLANSRSTR